MKNNRSVQKDNDISVGFKEVLYKVCVVKITCPRLVACLLL